MRLNNKGFAISSVMYLILVMALILVALILALLNSRKLILDRQKKDLIGKYESKGIDSLTTYEFNEIGSYIFTVPQTGMYKIELWGAEGGGSYGGKGAYTSGFITLKRKQILYFYVGSKGDTFNGGGSCSATSKIGGGATDVRLTDGEWNNVDSLKSRIMVAAGGGSVTDNSSNAKAGAGGTINGIDGVEHSAVSSGYGVGSYRGAGGTQTSGGDTGSDSTVSSTAGTFGIGGTCGTGQGDYNHIGAGGGGGYYGGGGSSWHAGSGGGSSFISGYIGCVCIITGTPVYTGYVFSNAEMIAGNDINLPSNPNSNGNGYAKITYIDS